MPGQCFHMPAVSSLVDFHHFSDGAAPETGKADERGIAAATWAEMLARFKIAYCIAAADQPFSIFRSAFGRIQMAIGGIEAHCFKEFHRLARMGATKSLP